MSKVGMAVGTVGAVAAGVWKASALPLAPVDERNKMRIATITKLPVRRKRSSRSKHPSVGSAILCYTFI
jgi:hypothetical protein